MSLALTLCFSHPAFPAPRVVSMSPAATEVLFSLGLEDKLIGVTRFCPLPEGSEIPRVADILGIDLETLLTMSPDLVVLSDMGAQLSGRIERMGIAVFVMRDENLAALRSSIEELARLCGAPSKGIALSDSIKAAEDEAAHLTKSLPRPRVAVVVDRDSESGRSLYVAGRASFYDEIIALAGGVNAFEMGGVNYPRLSAEGMLVLDPDVIIDIIGSHAVRQAGGLTGPERWRGSSLRAVRDGAVHVISGDYALRPGPNVMRLIRDFTSFIHPEVVSPN